MVWFWQGLLAWCVDGSLLSVFSHGGEESHFSVLPLIKALTPFMGDPPSQPDHSPKAPFPHTVTLGVRAPIWGFRGDTDIQVIAAGK